MSVYKPCDIRGPVAELSPALYYAWGRALGRLVGVGDGVAVGGDVRRSTPALLDALTEGLCEAGARVVRLGVLPTPMVYFAKRHLAVPACAIVTASHNPPDVNGLKWMIRDLPVQPEDVAALRRAVEADDFAPRPAGLVETLDIAPAYRAWLRGLPELRARPAGRIVIDPGNGCWSRRAAAYAAEVFPGLEIVTIFDEADGLYPGRGADVAKPRELGALCAAVVAHKAMLGIAFDGDGDRVAFVDGSGHALTAEEATWVLIGGFGEAWAGRGFVYDLKFSDRMAERAQSLGGVPHMERSGHAFIRRRMLAVNGLFGAEISGHYFYGALEGGDDGLYTALRLLAVLARASRTLEDERRTCPVITMTPDLRLPCAPEEGQAILVAIRDAFADLPQTTVDGIRVDFPDGWALARGSVTEPALTFRFESTTPDALASLVSRYCRRIPVLWERLYPAFQSTSAPATPGADPSTDHPPR